MTTSVTKKELDGLREVACKEVMLHASDAMVLATADGVIVGVNLSAAEMLGRNQAELTGKHVSELHPAEEHDRVLGVFEQLRDVGRSLVEHAVVRADGSLLRVEVSGTRIRDGGSGRVFMLGVFRDIERRRASERRQRAALVREVHHRIKNHLQGLSGLLAAHESRNGALGPALRDVQGQINSIALIHGLQSRKGTEEIWLCDMVRGVCGSIEGLWGLRETIPVHVVTEHPVCIGADESVPVALIVNELVGNAVKHCVDTSGFGGVWARVEGSAERARVTISNPGCLPEQFSLAEGEGLSSGLGLVDALLPPTGTELDIWHDDARGLVHATLALSAPILTGAREESEEDDFPDETANRGSGS